MMKSNSYQELRGAIFSIFWWLFLTNFAMKEKYDKNF